MTTQPTFTIRAGTSLMTWDHKRWVCFAQDTPAYAAIKYIHCAATTVYVVKSGPQRGTYAPHGC